MIPRGSCGISETGDGGRGPGGVPSGGAAQATRPSPSLPPTPCQSPDSCRVLTFLVTRATTGQTMAVSPPLRPSQGSIQTPPTVALVTRNAPEISKWSPKATCSKSEAIGAFFPSSFAGETGDGQRSSTAGYRCIHIFRGERPHQKRFSGAGVFRAGPESCRPATRYSGTGSRER